ncbi:MAG: diadenylate cyclase CdaA, partial [Chloroflexota bacterium]
MEQLIQQVGRLLARFEWSSVVDILILALLIYGLLSILQGTRAEILFRGVLIVLLAGFVIVSMWPSELPVLRWLVNNSLQVLLIAILVIFAPEMRRTLEQIGHTGDFINRPLSHRSPDAILLLVNVVVASATYLSNQRWGGLMILERTTGLQDIVNKGIPINGEVSSALLGNIFVPNTPLHDGAVIIRQNRIVAAACILPLSDNLTPHEHFGTRHKAAVGISEQSDAVAVVVSEETGKISIASGGRIYTALTRETLREMLISLLQPVALFQLSRRFKVWSQLSQLGAIGKGVGYRGQPNGQPNSQPNSQPRVSGIGGVSSDTRHLTPDTSSSSESQGLTAAAASAKKANPERSVESIGDETRRVLAQAKPSLSS